MKLLARYTRANIKGNRVRIPLIVLCIAVAVIMFTASIMLPKIVRNYADYGTRSVYGNSDLYITDSIDNANRVTSMYYMPEEVFSASEYVINIFALSGTVRVNNTLETANIFGVDYEDVVKFNEPIILEGNVNSLASDSIIISKYYADSVGAEVGSICKFSYADKTFSLKVAAIAENSGIFQWKSMNNIIVTKEAISSMVNAYIPVKGMFNICLIKLYNNSNTNMSIIENIIKESYPDWNVYRTYNQHEYDVTVQQATGPMIVSSVIVVLYCFFIILLTMFLVFDARTKQFATMKCMGASNGFQMKSVIFESVFYGIIGGAIGTGLSVLIINLLQLLPNRYLFENLGFEYYVIAFIFGAFFSIISSLVPALRAQKKSIRQTMVTRTQTKKQMAIIQFIAFIILAMSVIINIVQPFGKAKFLSIITFVSTIISALILIPYILRYILLVFRKIFKPKSFSMLYTQNSFTNSNLKVVSAIMLFSIFLVMFLSMVSSTIEGIGRGQLEIDYYSVSVDNIYDNQGSSIKEVAATNKNVKNIYEVTQYKNCTIKTNNKEISIDDFKSFDIDSIKEIYSGKFDGDEVDIINKLSTNRNYIVLHSAYKYVFGVDKGDLLKLTVSTVPEKQTFDVVVAGFVDVPESNASFAIMNKDVLNIIVDVNNYNSLYFEIDEEYANDLIATIQKNFGTRYTITKYFENRRLYYEGYQTPAMIFSWYVWLIIGMSVLFAVVGVYLSLRQNSKAHKTMNILGMGRAQFIRTNICLLLYTSLICTIVAILCILLSIKQMLNIILLFDFYVKLTINWELLVGSVLSTIFLIVFISVIVAVVHARSFKKHDRSYDE